ncbi:hypothetical protein BDQ17DRAFT_1420865 [Cyathus striatus]|nr:hypothetical protein BDQ17DRAFT_1420865 [Cyathus striatus]
MLPLCTLPIQRREWLIVSPTPRPTCPLPTPTPIPPTTSPISPSHGHVHVVSPPPRQESTQRKRPKYTRSKTGCMTCRVKKIKCDETKPNCMRCTHGQRDCTWPEGVPARKKPAARKDTADGRPSTAGSSEASTPPTREPTPPRRLASELNLVPPPQSRRSNEPYLQLHPVPSDPDPSRRQLDRLPPYPHHNPVLMSYPLYPSPSPMAAVTNKLTLMDLIVHTLLVMLYPLPTAPFLTPT